MKLLIIGGGGQLGSKIIKQAKPRFDTYATYLTRKPALPPSKIYEIDKTNYKAVSTIFQKIDPDVVIDTAALHSVDYCETHKENAWNVNVQGTSNVAEACKKHDTKMVFVSTDYVFDGKKGNYAEKDRTNPINYYGLTKLEAEKEVAEICENHIIVRSSVIYSWVPPNKLKIQSSSGKPLNFTMWLIKELSDGKSVKIVTDQFSSPTLADNLAETLLQLSKTEKVGIYHISGRSRLSRYDFSIRISHKMNLDENLISPITTDQLTQKAERPIDSSLNVKKVEKHLNLNMLTIEQALNQFSNQAIVGEDK